MCKKFTVSFPTYFIVCCQSELSYKCDYVGSVTHYFGFVDVYVLLVIVIIRITFVFMQRDKEVN